MRLMVDAGMDLAGGIIGAGVEELAWPSALKGGESIQVRVTILARAPSKSKPSIGIVTFKVETLRADGSALRDDRDLGCAALFGGVMSAARGISPLDVDESPQRTVYQRAESACFGPGRGCDVMVACDLPKVDARVRSRHPLHETSSGTAT